jgi:hypothetical protein
MYVKGKTRRRAAGRGALEKERKQERKKERKNERKNESKKNTNLGGGSEATGRIMLIKKGKARKGKARSGWDGRAYSPGRRDCAGNR